MTENPKLVDSGSDDNLSVNCEFEEKGNQKVLFLDHVNGLQQQGIKSDNYVVDMELLEKDINTKSRITTLQRNLSRKRSFKGGEKKSKQITSNDIRKASMVAISPRGEALRGGSMHEMPVVETLGTIDHAINFPVHNQITVMNGTSGTVAVESKYGGKRLSFRRSSSSSWAIGPRRILFFFATLSSLGSILLIYLTLSISKLNVEESALN